MRRPSARTASKGIHTPAGIETEETGRGGRVLRARAEDQEMDVQGVRWLAVSVTNNVRRGG